MTRNFQKLTLAVAMLFLQSCAFKTVQRHKGLVYLNADQQANRTEQKLDVFSPRHPASLKPVLVFFYGGNWTSGNRSLYHFLGNRFARKNVVMVIVDYPKSPEANYKEMANDAALSVKWVHEHVQQFGGDPNLIFVAGHSAGGHLAALISTDDHYFEELKMRNPIKGAVLIDAAGLDMYWYMKEVDYGPRNSYLNVFTKEPRNWKEASPIYHIRKDAPPMLILSGGRSYPTLISSNERFLNALRKQGLDPVFIKQDRRKHVPMITQFFNVYNPRYRDILRFMNAPSK